MDNAMPVKHGFFKRLQYLIPDDANLYTWLEKMGMSRGVADGLKKGSILGGESLALLFRIHRINTTWLLTGQGKPYVVDHFTRSSELIETLDDILTDEPETSVTELQAGEQKGLVLRLPCTVSVGKHNTKINYTATRVITGDYTLKEIEAITTIKQKQLPSRKLKNILSGDAGV